VLAIPLLCGGGWFLTEHLLPNPVWSLIPITYTYTLAEGPPGDWLLDVRPEAVLTQYLHDYISLAGTYPCVVDPHTDPTTWHDPIVDKQPCPIVRPVARMVVQTISVERCDGPDTGIPVPGSRSP
jgi:hypothetical protein